MDAVNSGNVVFVVLVTSKSFLAALLLLVTVAVAVSVAVAGAIGFSVAVAFVANASCCCCCYCCCCQSSLTNLQAESSCFGYLKHIADAADCCIVLMLWL